MRSTSLIAALIALMSFCVIAAGCGAVSGQEGSAEGSCGAPAPDLEARPAQAAPTEGFRLHGEGFFVGPYHCEEEGEAGSGGEPPLTASDQNIRIEFVQGDRSWALATVRSGEDLAFDAKLRVPDDAKPGQAVVKATIVGAGRSPAPTETAFSVLG